MKQFSQEKKKIDGQTKILNKNCELIQFHTLFIYDVSLVENDN